MSKVVTDNKHYSDIAEAIRSKGVEGRFKPAEMAGAIETIPSGGAEITDGIVIKARRTDGYITEVDFYGEVVPPRCFGYPTANGSPFGRYLTTINLKNNIKSIQNGAFAMCTELTSLPNELLSVQAIEQQAFWGCKNLVGSYTFPNITTLNSYIFRDCLKIDELHFPKVTVINSVSGYGKKLTVGSIGNGVTSMRYDWLQYNGVLTDLTIFCIGSKVDGYLTDSRRYPGGATAKIIFKASEDTTYNGVSYSAGETMLTSEVA